ncbi:MAG: glycerol-3-phosphate responsive antiterminator [Bacillus sp. (in: Bacteria)]|jgi:glycerol uptake operon antiterminator|nr:glycerol-3-phosphate responsive antiterminator [Bacillus sp. (in: firmicutes)]
MPIFNQQILPAVRSMKDFDLLLRTNYTYGVFLDMHVGMVKSVFQYAKQANKQMFLHMDLIHGLKSDEYATEYVCQEIKPYGIISTKGNVIIKAKQKGVYAIQRAFIIDSSAMEKSIKLVQKTEPHFIEVLPGVVPKVVQKLKQETGIDIIAGGLIETVEEVDAILQAGACAITTSNVDLWKHFEPNY